VLFLHDVWVRTRAAKPLAYSEFQAFVRDGKVKES